MGKVKYNALEKYLLANKEQDARIVMGFMNNYVYVYPNYPVQIRVKTAEAAIKKLSLKGINAYKDSRTHPTGAALYVFPEHLYKY